jgi:hypothetical protein
MSQMEKRRNKHGKVLRSVLLTRMSQHMASPSTQREVGIPTVICVHGECAVAMWRPLHHHRHHYCYCICYISTKCSSTNNSS